MLRAFEFGIITIQGNKLGIELGKCHFMVQKHIVLRRRISTKGIEVDRAKISDIEKLPPSTSVKGVRDFLGHARFYRRLIKDFSKITKPLCNILAKDVTFDFQHSKGEAYLSTYHHSTGLESAI